jgi:hypothetical protein
MSFDVFNVVEREWKGGKVASLFVWLISHQPAVLFSQNKPATCNQPTVLFSHNKSAPAISHQPHEQAVNKTWFTLSHSISHGIGCQGKYQRSWQCL